jgi:hypothetical protein
VVVLKEPRCSDTRRRVARRRAEFGHEIPDEDIKVETYTIWMRSIRRCLPPAFQISVGLPVSKCLERDQSQPKSDHADVRPSPVAGGSARPYSGLYWQP